MSADEIELALEPFRQVSAMRRGEGRGLGLPLAKALVEANRGSLAITSKPGEGTLIEILFPRSVGAETDLGETGGTGLRRNA
jgi:signal transduction histidine kinase